MGGQIKSAGVIYDISIEMESSMHLKGNWILIKKREIRF